MPAQIKKILVWIFWIFVIYAIFTDPDRAAGLLREAGQLLVNGFESLGRFFNQLLQR